MGESLSLSARVDTYVQLPNLTVHPCVGLIRLLLYAFSDP